MDFEVRKIGLDELKKRQLDILDVVTKFCKENNINYFLDCGTLLGAVRHSGFIPWDDDIDIGMMRKDYDTFLKLFNEKNTQYKALTCEIDDNFLYPICKVLDTNTVLYEPNKKTGVKLCINIDVFVYDNAPDDDIICDKMFKKRDLYNRLRYIQLCPDRYDHSSIIKRIERLFLKLYIKIIPKNYYTKKVIENSKKFVNSNTKRVGNFLSQTKFVCDKEIFSEFTTLTFENKKYQVPKRYDEYLTIFYGDYMKLPPIEKRISKHEFEAYILDDKKGLK